jgi:predicted nuclease of predicted toxin-antitoxin system
MKVLLDENISYRILKKIGYLFEDCKHVNEIGLTSSSDTSIWEFAYKNGYVIITFDADYQELSVLKGFPPKVIWLNTGNMRTDKLASLIISYNKVIHDFYEDKQLGCLEIM